jgi:hypothetical protein
VQPEVLCQCKIPMTPSGIDSATFRFVAQCFNHCATACPTFLMITNRILRIRNVSDKSCTHITLSNFFPEYCIVYGIMWKNSVQSDRPQMTVWRTRIACWTGKATNSHSVYVYLMLLHDGNGYANAPQYYVIRSLLVFSIDRPIYRCWF